MAGCLSLPFRYALATNSTSTGFTAQNASATEPSGAGVFDLARADFVSGSTSGVISQRVPTFLQLMPFGTAANDKTFDMRVYGFNPTMPTDLVTDTEIYIPQLLLDVSCVTSALTFSGHAANTFLCDTLTVNDGAADNAEWRSLIDCQEDLPASIIIHTRGCRYIKFDWDLAGAAEATSMNCLWRPLDF